jgi:hypothetical protein
MKKSFIITSMAAFAALCFSLTAQAQGPVVLSDKADYAPGETAVFTASGFQPNELLDFSVGVSDDNGGWLPDVAWADIPADASGGADVTYVVPETWLNKTLQLTVMGLTSGLMAQTTFTDAPIPDTTTISASPTPPVVGGTLVTLTATVSASPSPGPTCGKLRIEESTDGGTTWPIIVVEENPTDGTVSTVFDTTGLGGTSPQFRAHYISSGSGCNYAENHDAMLTLPITVPASPTPSPSATPSPTPCQNSPPVITCASPTPNADLGKVVGCLGTGTGFGQTFPVTYSNDGPGTTVTVTAHVALPDSSTVDVDVATVTDPNGNTVTVTQSGTTSVTISGPGSGSASFSVNIDADDGQDCNNTASNMCDGTATADIVYHVAYLPPLYDTKTTKVKQGSTVPVKMRLTDCSGIAITPDNIVEGTPTLADVKYLSGAAPQGPPEIDDAGASSGDTTYFRWSPAPDLFWIFNLKTNSSYYVGNTYEIWPSNVDQPADISIK